MQKPLDPTFRRDLFRLGFFVLAVIAGGMFFLWTPALSLPTLVSVVITTLLSPWIKALERRGLKRSFSILVVLSLLGVLVFGGGFLAAKNWQNEWISFQNNAPDYIASVVSKISSYEASLKSGHPILGQLHVAESLSSWSEKTGVWFSDRAPGLMGKLLSCLFLCPILTFCFLSEGRKIRRKFFLLVPNRFFESVYIVSSGISTALSDYLRAKLIEAFLVGFITTLGLSLIHSPYAIVLGLWAGLTNIVPYIGPPLGALPGILVASFDPNSADAIFATVSVYGLANLIDSIFIFPWVVGNLVKLNPLVLTASVVLGQYYFGIVGMLISIPIAAAIKVVFSELYVVVYGFVPDP